ncbi:MAG: SurA N-terminal domain-containing protein [Streptosporangiaceae bacterium]
MIRITLAAVAVIAALTACGSPVQAGAAATLNDSTISSAELNSAVADWQDLLKANPRAREQLQLAFPESEQRSVLTNLVQIEIGKQAAKDAGITISPAEIDAVVTRLSGGRGQEAFDLGAMTIGVPPESSRDFAELVAIETRLGAGETTDAARVSRVKGALVKAAEKMKVKVNPRFGSFDLSAFSLTAPTTKLSAVETGTT